MPDVRHQPPSHTAVLIALTQGQFAWVDSTDYALVAPHRWTAFLSRNTWYAKTRIHGKTVYMHRLILFGNEETNMKVDHVNSHGLEITGA